MLHTLGIQTAADPIVLPDTSVPTGRDRVRAEVEWARTFAGPWVYRRLRGRSLGDGITPKRPVLAPIAPSEESVDAVQGRRPRSQWGG